MESDSDAPWTIYIPRRLRRYLYQRPRTGGAGNASGVPYSQYDMSVDQEEPSDLRPSVVTVPTMQPGRPWLHYGIRPNDQENPNDASEVPDSHYDMSVDNDFPMEEYSCSPDDAASFQVVQGDQGSEASKY